MSGLTLSLQPPGLWQQRPPGAARDHSAQWPIPGPGAKVTSMPRAVREPGFLMFNITVLLCTTAALHKKEENSTSKKCLTDLYPCANHWCSHWEQWRINDFSGLTFLHLGQSLAFYHTAFPVVFFFFFWWQSLVSKHFRGAPSCLPTPFLKVWPIILCHSFPFFTYSVLEEITSRWRAKSCDDRVTEQLRVEGNYGGHLVHPPAAQAGPPKASCSGSWPGGF